MSEQAQLNQSEFQDMDDETRAQYEGFRPGAYVRVEVSWVPNKLFTLAEMVSNPVSLSLVLLKGTVSSISGVTLNNQKIYMYLYW